MAEPSQYADWEFLAEGSYGQVYRRNDRAVKSMKMIENHLDTTFQEIHWCSTFLQSSVSYQGGKFWIEMPYFPESFEKSSMSLEQKSLELVRAVAELHSRGICHRDLKPFNLRIDRNSEGGKVQILDFGNTVQFPEFMNLNAHVFTKWWAPPNSRNKVWTFNGDVWSLGVILTQIWFKNWKEPVIPWNPSRNPWFLEEMQKHQVPEKWKKIMLDILDNQSINIFEIAERVGLSITPEDPNQLLISGMPDGSGWKSSRSYLQSLCSKIRYCAPGLGPFFSEVSIFYLDELTAGETARLTESDPDEKEWWKAAFAFANAFYFPNEGLITLRNVEYLLPAAIEKLGNRCFRVVPSMVLRKKHPKVSPQLICEICAVTAELGWHLEHPPHELIAKLEDILEYPEKLRKHLKSVLTSCPRLRRRLHSKIRKTLSPTTEGTENQKTVLKKVRTQ